MIPLGKKLKISGLFLDRQIKTHSKFLPLRYVGDGLSGKIHRRLISEVTSEITNQHIYKYNSNIINPLSHTKVFFWGKITQKTYKYQMVTKLEYVSKNI